MEDYIEKAFDTLLIEYIRDSKQLFYVEDNDFDIDNFLEALKARCDYFCDIQDWDEIKEELRQYKKSLKEKGASKCLKTYQK